MTKPSHEFRSGLSAPQGTGEKHSKTYKKYGGRASEPVTLRRAKSLASVSSSAGKLGQASRAKFAVFDIDGTLIRWQLYHAIGDALAKRHLISKDEYATVKEARMAWKRRTHHDSFKDYERALIAAFDTMLKKISTTDFSEVVNEVFEEYKDQAYAFSRDLLKQLKREGYLLFAISGSPEEIVQKIATYYEFDDFIGSHYATRGATFTGEKIVAARDKKRLLTNLIRTHNLDIKDSIGVGDTDSDIAMLECVERPIALNPTKELYAHARTHGWQIVVERKNVVYKLKDSDGSYILA